MKRTIFLNEDDAHFYSCHPAEDMTEEGARRLVDYYATDTQVACVLFCINLQKTNFKSKVWESLFDRYHPDGGPDQPLFQDMAPKYREIIPGDHAANWIHNVWLLHQRGVDHHAVWLERCRHHGIEGWLTMRMNDCHGLEEYARKQDGTGNYDGWAMLCPSEHWKQHPELRRAPYRYERSWEGAYDYRFQEVRDHHLALIEEACGRWDFDGFEMDWLRWGLLFAPGYEQEGRELLSDFVRQARGFCDKAAKRVGHPVRLGARVPPEPQVCLAMGYDVPRWVREGWIDQITASGFGGAGNYDYPIELWRLLIGDNVRILTLCEGATYPHAGYGPPICSPEFQYANAASALYRGADGVYLFNDCYAESSEPAAFKKRLQTMGDLDVLGRTPRRHPVTHPGVHLAGQSSRSVLPIPLRNEIEGYDIGRMEQNITARVYCGRIPSEGSAMLHLGFSPEVEVEALVDMPVWVNGHPVKPTANRGQSGVEANTVDWTKPHQATKLKGFLGYPIPLELLQDDSNAIEFEPPKLDGEVRWVEIQFIP